MIRYTESFQFTSNSWYVSVVNYLIHWLGLCWVFFFSYYRSNGEVVCLRPKSEVEPVGKPKLESEPLPLRPKSVEVDSLVAKSSKESGKKRKKPKPIVFFFGLSVLDCSILQG